MTEITRNQFCKLEKNGIFENFKKQNGYYPFNKTGRKYYIVEHNYIKEALKRLEEK